VNLLVQSYKRPKSKIEDNFIFTVANDFDLLGEVEKSNSIIKPDLNDFLRSHPEGIAKIWALKSTSKSKTIFTKLQEGDLVLFHGKSLIYGYGTISSKIFWPSNHYIWPDGVEREYLYTFKSFAEIPEASRVTKESLGQLFPNKFRDSDFLVNLASFGIKQSDVIKHLQITPPYINENSRKRKIRDISNPPLIGESFNDRKSIWKAFGGQWQQRIVMFPGEKTVNVFSDENGPFPDFKDPENGVIEYRGQRIRKEQALVLGNKLLEEARLERRPIRFWHRPVGRSWIFETWALAVDRTQIIEEGPASASSQRILWFLVPIPSLDSSLWPNGLHDLKILELPEIQLENLRQNSDLLKNYSSISAELEMKSIGKKVSTSPISLYRRRKEARDLVIARSRNKCEHDRCTGMPPDVNRQGHAIIQVDHINPLANGGADIPSNMIALCPNCHSAKTYGLHSDQFTKRFQIIVSRIEQLL